MTDTNKCCGRVHCEVVTKSTASLKEEIRKELDTPDKDIEALLNKNKEEEVDQ
mgnify:FL=1|tara:strand:+ start:632 stop:790 length:159 start_codon:yes stop_codon:yes gene_type:complete